MREFASSAPLGRLPTAAKALYTAFAVLNLAGLGSSVVLYDRIVDFGVTSTPADLHGRLVAHYVPEAGGETAVVARRELANVTHAHLFSMSVLLLVAGHLLLLSSAPRWAKHGLLGAGCTGVVLHLAAPWVIVATEGRFAAALVYPVSGALLMLSLGAMCCLPLWDMWRRERRTTAQP